MILLEQYKFHKTTFSSLAYTYVFFFLFLLKDHETQALKDHLIDELDYVLVPTEAWNKLVSWYGCLEGQRPIVRKVRLLKIFLILAMYQSAWTGLPNVSFLL